MESLQTFVKRKIPIRFGIVPLTNSEAALNQAKVVYHLQNAYGLGAVIAYIEAVSLQRFLRRFIPKAADHSV